MSDEDGPFIAKHFYEKVYKNPDRFHPDYIPYALDYAVKQLRSSGVPPERWAPFIHLGA
jgi:hypothetical protein